jgi:hypothetical protein
MALPMLDRLLPPGISLMLLHFFPKMIQHQPFPLL